MFKQVGVSRVMIAMQIEQALKAILESEKISVIFAGETIHIWGDGAGSSDLWCHMVWVLNMNGFGYKKGYWEKDSEQFVWEISAPETLLKHLQYEEQQ